VQHYWRERERVNKRKHPKVWGAGESGVARGPETEVMLCCQMVWGKQSAVVCVVCVEGGAGRCGCVSVLAVSGSLEKADL
jgi:hypothetical protein